LPPLAAIRPATAADLGDIGRIQEASSSASQWEVARYLTYDAQVAVVGGKVHGFIVTRKAAADESEVLNLAIDPEQRRLGIASELMRHAMKRLPGEMFLEVRESNLPARNLYRKLGFEEAGLRKNYYQNPPESAIVMKLRTC
ncbi:MAG: ribosomal protein S18-alanine N-acetyltransferase, partial [Acidobacteria bacterium]|nr:ribosomal protein S18-alanine N-acetyltransferase [Acidobacteriota bacterium]